eukprot:scaffold2402_cov109-Cylindrotheca_fusiformis.AAC.4
MNEKQLPVNNQYQWCQATEAAVQHPSLMFFYATIPSNNASRCFPNPSLCCSKYQDYYRQRSEGKKILGRPPHDGWCPRAAGYNY